jgi:hypothetical protein
MRKRISRNEKLFPSFEGQFSLQNQEVEEKKEVKADPTANVLLSPQVNTPGISRTSSAKSKLKNISDSENLTNGYRQYSSLVEYDKSERNLNRILYLNLSVCFKITK